MRYIRTAGIGASFGLAAGLVWGLAGRLAMRIMALVAGRPTEFSAGGTLLILLVGAFFGIPLGLLFIGVRRYLPGSDLRKSILFGLVVLLVLGYPFYLGPLRGETVLGHETLAFVMFESLLVMFGVLIAAVASRLDRYTPLAGRRLGKAVSFGLLAVPCGVELLVVALMIAESSG